MSDEMNEDLKGIAIIAVCVTILFSGFIGCTVITSQKKSDLVRVCVERGNNPSECANLTESIP